MLLDCEEFEEEDLVEQEQVEEKASEEEEFLENLAKVYPGQLKEYVVALIEKFFADKKMHYGGPISKKLLLSDNYIRMVANIRICPSIRYAYDTLAKSEKISCESTTGLISDDIRLVLSVLDKCAKKHISKYFAGGLMLMYLELCEGLELAINEG